MSTGMAQDDAEVESLQHKQQLLSSEKLDISQKLSQLQQEMEHDIMQFQQTDAELQHRNKEQVGRLAALDKVLNLYKSCLGLELVPGEEELLLKFTQIDPQDHEKPFCFAVKVLEDESYEGMSLPAAVSRAVVWCGVVLYVHCDYITNIAF
eukprot:jgi/Chrzof1/8975/Cz03g31170.t1